ncbi:cytochrome P450 [Amycolatopsis acididurans]|uniref:cytochrome P450 n=1 Tax=Amycolatopsis acididurans TaxID=2724524 RepID=UPI001B325D0A|nr:cytochrome P450 [Amycolatopsis acididurans]
MTVEPDQSTPSRTPSCPTDPETAFAELVSLHPEAVRCPYPTFALLREQAPVHWSDALGAFVVSRHDDIVEVLRDPGIFSSRLQSGASSVTGLAQRLVDDTRTSAPLRAQALRRLEINRDPALLNADPPLHIRQRKLVSQAFTPRRVAQLEPEVRQVAGELLGALKSRSSFDFVTSYAMPLPMTIIARMLGVPEERLDDFKRWSDAFTQGVGANDLSEGQVSDLFESVDEFYDYFTDQIERRRVAAQDDLLTDLVTARLPGDRPLTVHEMLQMLVVFLVGGNETTTNLLTAMTHRLLSDAELEQRVRQDESLIPAFAEEMLRLESPVQGLFRTATCDAEVAGVPIPGGSMVWLAYAAGNRDEALTSAPDELHLDTERPLRHLAFGRGVHTCLGAAIARLEARVGIEMLLRHYPALRLAADAGLRMHRSFVLHGIASLPVVVGNLTAAGNTSLG